VTVDLSPEQFALLDQAIGAIRQRLGTEDVADALELIARAYLARVDEDEPALRQQIVVHRCRACRQEWRETSKGRVPVRATTAPTTPTALVEVDLARGGAGTGAEFPRGKCAVPVRPAQCSPERPVAG
jgi:hypothetical protein